MQAESFTARSWLFAPGDSEKKMTKATGGAADIVLLDLEDAVAPEAKADARRMVHDFIAANPDERHRLWVRINPFDGEWTLLDLAAIMPARPGGIMLPKIEGRADVERLDHCLSALEVANGIEEGSTRVILLATETAASMFHTGDYKGCRRVVALSWGAEDLAASLGVYDNTDDEGRYRFTFELARSLTLVGAVTAEVIPIETISANFRDLDALRERAQRVRREGFKGMMAIHPAQVDIINQAFTPTEEEIAEAQEIVALFAANPGVGTIGFKGGMLDKPFLARAEALLKQAGR
ncbi:MAG: CoA ester lyase [Sphingomonadaceae bacterium]|nr:CoA ester lyase [Sphingomonadaceae bacterium]